ncbi:unnamed protein product [Discosporangium mesarthrocarpum]
MIMRMKEYLHLILLVIGLVCDSGLAQVALCSSSEFVGVDNAGVSGVVPEQVHISLASPRPRGEYDIAVSWVTWSRSETQVRWGSSEVDLVNLVEGVSTSEILDAF